MNLLWADDRISKFEDHINIMVMQGINVFKATTTNEARSISESEDIDATITDLLIPSDTGVQLLHDYELTIPNAKHHILSNYDELKAFKEEIRRIDLSAKVVNKDQFPDANSLEFSRICDKLTMGHYFVRSSKQSRGDGYSFFEIDYKSFMSKPIQDQIQLNNLVMQENRELLADEFANGIKWVLFCGSDGEIVGRANKPSDIWPLDKVMGYAEKIGTAPYQFRAPMVVEELGWGQNCLGEGTGRYPTVTLKMGRIKSTVHFDTGSEASWFDLEHYMDQDIDFKGLPESGSTQWGDYGGIKFTRACLLVDQKTEETRSVTVNGLAIKGWEEAGFERLCEDTCPDAEGKHCRFRRALVGRNLLHDNTDVSIVLDAAAGKTRFEV